MEDCLAELEEEEEEEENIINELDGELFEINTRLNNELLCKGCCKVKKLTDKCGNREIADFLYECGLNAKHWIPFNKFKNIEYLVKGGFGKVHEETWIDGYYRVVLERIYNSNDKTVDILKEVK